MAALSGARTAVGPGRWAAPDSSTGAFMARVIASPALRSSRPKTSKVSSVRGAGSTLMVTSVITASVPQEPAMSLGRS